MQTEGMVHVIKEEIVIFEIEQHAEVDGQTQQHQRQADGFLFLREHQLAERIIDEDASGDDGHIAGIVVSVKDERCQHEKDLVELYALGQLAQQKVTQQRQRQESQHKDVGIKQHIEISPCKEYV